MRVETAIGRFILTIGIGQLACHQLAYTDRARAVRGYQEGPGIAVTTNTAVTASGHQRETAATVGDGADSAGQPGRAVGIDNDQLGEQRVIAHAEYATHTQQLPGIDIRG